MREETDKEASRRKTVHVCVSPGEVTERKLNLFLWKWAVTPTFRKSIDCTYAFVVKFLFRRDSAPSLSSGMWDREMGPRRSQPQPGLPGPQLCHLTAVLVLPTGIRQWHPSTLVLHVGQHPRHGAEPIPTLRPPSGDLHHRWGGGVPGWHGG